MPTPYTVIESVELNGTHWGVSLNGPNPEAIDYFACRSKEHAWRLYEVLHADAAHAALLAFAQAYRLDLQERGVRESDMDESEMELLNMADAAIALATAGVPTTHQPQPKDTK